MTQEMVQRLDMNALITRAVEGNTPVETLERLFALAKEVRAENARAAWHEAMAKFQANVPDIKKTKVATVTSRRTGNTFKYAYAALDEVISAVRPALAKQGLSVTFEIAMDSVLVTARCIVAHAEGHAQVTEFTIPIETEGRMNPAQAVASASTYARRYAYLAALGLAPEDDDDGAEAGDVPETAAPRAAVANPPSYDTSKNTPPTKVAPVREYENEQGQPVWRGTLLSHREWSGKDRNGLPYVAHFFKGQDGKEFTTFKPKDALTYIELLREVVEVTWEPAANKKDGRDIVEVKKAMVTA